MSWTSHAAGSVCCWSMLHHGRCSASQAGRYTSKENRSPDGAYALVQMRRKFHSAGSQGSDLLVLSMLRDCNSYGDNRNCTDFLQTIISMTSHVDYERLSIGLLVEERHEFKKLSRVAIDTLDVRRIAIVSPPALQATSLSIDRLGRQNSSLQRQSRRRLAQLRNYLTNIALLDEAYIFWLDADIIHVPAQLLPAMLSSPHPVLVPIVTLGGAYYDQCAVVAAMSFYTAMYTCLLCRLFLR